MIWFALKLVFGIIGGMAVIALIYLTYNSYNEWCCHVAYVADRYGIMMSFDSFKQYYYLAPSCWRVDSTDSYASRQSIDADLTLNSDDYHYWLTYKNDGKTVRVGMETWKDYRQLVKFLRHAAEDAKTSKLNANQRANYEWFLQDMQAHIAKLKEQAKQEREEAEQSISDIVDKLKEEYNLG